jgi:hypothetical protein
MYMGSLKPISEIRRDTGEPGILDEHHAWIAASVQGPNVPEEVRSYFVMAQGRKRVILIAVAIPAARKLAQYDGGERPGHDLRRHGRDPARRVHPYRNRPAMADKVRLRP